MTKAVGTLRAAGLPNSAAPLVLRADGKGLILPPRDGNGIIAPPRLRAFDDDEDDWEEEEDEGEYEDEDEGECPEPELIGASYAPVFTGILKPDGSPLLRHPVVMRMGFHQPDKKLHCPTLDENQFGEEDGRIFGWVYD